MQTDVLKHCLSHSEFNEFLSFFHIFGTDDVSGMPTSCWCQRNGAWRGQYTGCKETENALTPYIVGFSLCILFLSGFGSVQGEIVKCFTAVLKHFKMF